MVAYWIAIKDQKIFGVPLKISNVPVRVPQAGNRWFTAIAWKSKKKN